MALFDGLFKKRNRDIPESMNPLLGMKLRDFVVNDSDPVYLKHYFNFRNKKGADEEFIIFYHRDGPKLTYISTLSRRSAWGTEFQTLSERGPWSMAITYLVEQGHQLSAKTPSTADHFTSRIRPRTALKSTKPKAKYGIRPSSAGTPSGQQTHEAKAPLEAGEWQVRYVNSGADESKRTDEISRTYHFSGLPNPEANATLKIVCLLKCLAEDDQNYATIESSLRFVVRPFHLSGETSFVLRLATAAQSQGGVFYALASPIEGDPDTALISIRRGEDTKNCIDVIKSGASLTFVLADQREIVIDFHLPNDSRFTLLYDDASKDLSDHEAASKLSNAVRRNPNDYTVWMHEPKPGEFAVLLVKLDNGGNPADGWKLGSFNSGAEQRSLALEIARDFKIRLMK
jgi:hypothetical protein